MPTIFIAEENGIGVYDPDRDAKVGRWCRAPLVPDRCYNCWDKETLAHYPAEGYYEETDCDGTIWRYGICHRCLKRVRRRGKVILFGKGGE